MPIANANDKTPSLEQKTLAMSRNGKTEAECALHIPLSKLQSASTNAHRDGDTESATELTYK